MAVNLTLKLQMDEIDQKIKGLLVRKNIKSMEHHHLDNNSIAGQNFTGLYEALKSAVFENKVILPATVIMAYSALIGGGLSGLGRLLLFYLLVLNVINYILRRRNEL